jgi:hypothetical protein
MDRQQVSGGEREADPGLRRATDRGTLPPAGEAPLAGEGAVTPPPGLNEPAKSLDKMGRAHRVDTRPANWRSLRNAGRIKTPEKTRAARRLYDARKQSEEPEPPARTQRMWPDGSVECAICRERTSDKAADHCHATGCVRDWLCRRCNAGLGFFRDNPAYLRAAADYIERHRNAPQTGLPYTLAHMRRLSKRQVERMAAQLLSDETPRNG